MKKYQKELNLSRLVHNHEEPYTPMNYEEIVKRIATHFDEIIQNARRIQNITTIRDMDRYLNLEDVEEKKNLLRRQGNFKTREHKERNRGQNNRLQLNYNC